MKLAQCLEHRYFSVSSCFSLALSPQRQGSLAQVELWLSSYGIVPCPCSLSTVLLKFLTSSVSKPKDGFRGRAFKGNIRGESCRVCDQLVGLLLMGLWWGDGNLNHPPSGSSLPGVSVLVLSTWSPPSTWVGVFLVSAEHLKGRRQIVTFLPWGRTRTLSYWWTSV